MRGSISISSKGSRWSLCSSWYAESRNPGREGDRRMKLGDVAAAVGKGLFAGAAGTAAMTLSSTMEMKLGGRPASSSPADAAPKVLGVAPPFWEWGAKEVAIDAFHHLVYASATGVAYTLLDRQ